MTISNIENIIESLKNQIKGLDMQIEDRRKEIESARYQISHRRAGALGNDSDRMIIARAQERITQLNAQKKQVNAQIASYKEALRKAKAEEAKQKAKEKEREKRRRDEEKEREKRRRDEEKEREKRAKEAEREHAKRIKAAEREDVNASIQQRTQGTRAQARKLENRVRIEQAARQAAKIDPDDDYLRVYNDYCLKLLYFLYKKFDLTKCRDWNLMHIWKRFKQNKNN